MKNALIPIALVLIAFSPVRPDHVFAQTPKIPTPPAQRVLHSRTISEVAPEIILDASLYTGNLGEDWRNIIVFSDYAGGITFRWTYEGPVIDHAEAQIHDESGKLLKSTPIQSVGPREYGSFVVSLARLPQRAAYLVRIRPIGTNGSAIDLPSNTVTLLYN